MGSKRTAYSYMIVAFVALGSLTFGYSNVIIGTTLAQPTFISYFGIDQLSNADAISGATSGIYTGGGRMLLPLPQVLMNEALPARIVMSLETDLSSNEQSWELCFHHGPLIA